MKRVQREVVQGLEGKALALADRDEDCVCRGIRTFKIMDVVRRNAGKADALADRCQFTVDCLLLLEIVALQLEEETAGFENRCVFGGQLFGLTASQDGMGNLPAEASGEPDETFRKGCQYVASRAVTIVPGRFRGGA